MQLPDWFMILRSSSGHVCTYTYSTNYVHDEIHSAKKRKHSLDEVRSRDGHVEHVCQSPGCMCYKRRGHVDFCAENMSPSSTLFMGVSMMRNSTWYLLVINIRIDGASGIRRGGNFHRLR